jgi:hypothetical protein
MKVTLYNFITEDIKITIEAYFENDHLVIDGLLGRFGL